MSDTFDSMPSNYFFSQVKPRFDFLSKYYRFSIISEEVTEDFLIPKITYRWNDFYIAIGRGRGSVVVFTGLQNGMKLGFAFSQICYFLDTGDIPSDRGEGYSPGPAWEIPLEQRINEQLDWYADYLKQNLNRVLDLFFDDEMKEKKQTLISKRLEELEKIKEFLDSKKS
jgi:hypothetical protein